MTKHNDSPSTIAPLPVAASGARRQKTWRWLAVAGVGAAVLASALGLAGVALADDHDDRDHHRRHSERYEREWRKDYRGDGRSQSRQAVPMPKAYQAECASCHMGFEPRFLPAASWQRMMGNLKDHYGTDASLDAATVASINQWLLPLAGTYKRVLDTPPPEDRITKSPWFLRKHREVSAATFKRASIKSPANCMACHSDADKGDYDDDAVRIPK